MTVLTEGLERGDLKRLLNNRLHIDEFRSKMGKDEDVCVISFKVDGKEPALDLVSFVEKGYDWVIDADVSSGEMDDGSYVVFVEAERNADIAEHIMEMIDDVMNLVLEDIGEWQFKYHKNDSYQPITLENLKQAIPRSNEEYLRLFGKKDIDSLKAAAGVKVTTRAPENELTDSVRIAAGIK